MPRPDRSPAPSHHTESLAHRRRRVRPAAGPTAVDLEQQIALRCWVCDDVIMVAGQLQCKRRRGCRLASQRRRLAELDNLRGG